MARRRSLRPSIPCPTRVYIHTERKKPGATLELLHLDYLEKHPVCEYYRQWLARHRLTMTPEHRAGEKTLRRLVGKQIALGGRGNG